MKAFPKAENNKYTGAIAMHLLAWTALLIFPLLFSTGEQSDNSYFYYRSVISLGFSAITFYLNYFYFAQQFLFKDKLVQFLLINVILIGICVIGMQWAQEELRHLMHFKGTGNLRGRQTEWRQYVMLRNSFSFLLTAGISVAIRATQKWIHSEAEKRTLENENLLSQLSHLKYQLQPHFFFNSLNSIYSLIDTSPDKAKETVHTLGKLMRYVLYETNDARISVAKEIEFLQQYIRLMQIRFSSQLQVLCTFPETTGSHLIAPLLLVPLVENSFKHGVSSLSKSVVKIIMKQESEVLTFITENAKHPKPKEDESGSGVGLENLKQRLALLYPARSTFSQELIDDKIITILKIHL